MVLVSLSLDGQQSQTNVGVFQRNLLATSDKLSTLTMQLQGVSITRTCTVSVCGDSSHTGEFIAASHHTPWGHALGQAFLEPVSVLAVARDLADGTLTPKETEMEEKVILQ